MFTKDHYLVLFIVSIVLATNLLFAGQDILGYIFLIIAILFEVKFMSMDSPRKE